MQEINMDLVKNILPIRKKDSNKGTYGTLLCICGSYGMAGASILCAKAAQKCGVGMVNIAIPKSIYNIVGSNIVESIFTLLSENSNGTISYSCRQDLFSSLKKSTACVVGCGLGNNQDTKMIVYDLIKKYKNKLIIDADGINAINENIDILKTVKSNIILTPHMGEMARLLKLSIPELKNNKLTIAKKFAQNYKIVLVLKDFETLIATPHGSIFINKKGNPGMATAGSGDVLAGMIASFAAQGISTIDSALAGVYLHSLAGDICAEKYSEISMTSGNIIEELPSLFLKLQ